MRKNLDVFHRFTDRKVDLADKLHGLKTAGQYWLQRGEPSIFNNLWDSFSLWLITLEEFPRGI